jgi:RNA polymerase sigma factor (sigma-70 family)
MTSQSDRELVAAAAKGQAAAFATLIGRYRDVHTRFAIRMLGGYDPADEALLAAFTRGFQSLARVKEPDDFSDWLFRIVINECRARALRKAVRERRLTGETQAVGAGPRPTVEPASEAQRALEQIDPINREAFILQYVEELTYPQIAALTSASVVTLERQVDRACARLRELLPQLHKDHRDALARPADGIDVGPSFPVRVAAPLRRPEVLNDSFEDRLMAKLLRSVEVPDAASTGDAPIVAPGTASRAAKPAETEPLAPPSLAPWRRKPTFNQIAGMGTAAALIALAFAAGDAVRGRSDAAGRSTRVAKATAQAPRIVRHTDTVRVSRSDTVVLARFVLAEPTAHAVSVVGDFNRWDAESTPLSRVGEGAWAASLRLRPGRYEYAFIVDGKHWATDRFARTLRDEFDTQSSVLATTALSQNGPATGEGGTLSSRIKKALPRSSADHVLSAFASLKSSGLPVTPLENRALKFIAKRVAAKDIERSIVGEAERLARSRALLASVDRAEPTEGEIVAGAELLRYDSDTSRIKTLIRGIPANRPVEVPLRVSEQLMANDVPAHDALARVEERLRSGASDTQLERLLDEPTARVASQKSKGKAARVAKSSSSASVHQAGTPKKKKP